MTFAKPIPGEKLAIELGARMEAYYRAAAAPEGECTEPGTLILQAGPSRSSRVRSQPCSASSSPSRESGSQPDALCYSRTSATNSPSQASHRKSFHEHYATVAHEYGYS